MWRILTLTERVSHKLRMCYRSSSTLTYNLEKLNRIMEVWVNYPSFLYRKLELVPIIANLDQVLILQLSLAHCQGTVYLSVHICWFSTSEDDGQSFVLPSQELSSLNNSGFDTDEDVNEQSISEMLSFNANLSQAADQSMQQFTFN